MMMEATASKSVGDKPEAFEMPPSDKKKKKGRWFRRWTCFRTVFVVTTTAGGGRQKFGSEFFKLRPFHTSE